jgi:hypothetical protein
MASPPPHPHHEGMTAPWPDTTDEQRCRWLAEASLRRSAGHTGWRITSYDDAAHRFLAIAVRR